VHAGDGKVEGYLLIGRQVQVRQVERVAVDQVPVLFVARQADRSDRDALVAQESLVAFEGLPARRMFGGIARHLQRDRVERQRLIRVEKDQDEIRHAFESVESCRGSHRAEPTAAAVA